MVNIFRACVGLQPDETMAERADNVLAGTMFELVDQVRAHVRDFKAASVLEKVIVLWTGNTERFAELREGLRQLSSCESELADC